MKAHLKHPFMCNFMVKYLLSPCSKLLYSTRPNIHSGLLLFCIVLCNVRQQEVHSANVFAPVMPCMFKAAFLISCAPLSVAHSPVPTRELRNLAVSLFRRTLQARL